MHDLRAMVSGAAAGAKGTFLTGRAKEAEASAARTAAARRAKLAGIGATVGAAATAWTAARLGAGIAGALATAFCKIERNYGEMESDVM